MTQLLVEGVSIELPSSISIEYSAENRLLTQADGYSLGIEIPLKGSAVNSGVFGFVWRKDADIYSLRFNAVLMTPQVVLRGVVMIVGVSERDITIQFLEGRSQQNSELTFEESYINELTLGYTALPVARRSITVDDAHRRYGEPVGDIPADAVALPWVIRDSGEIVHNSVALRNNTLSWVPQWSPGRPANRIGDAPAQENLSYMPYLLTVAVRVARAMGYSYDFSPWEEDPVKRDLLVCNTVPASLRLRDFSWAMPHWTVNEFFENIETILEGEFDIDHGSRRISFRFTADILADTPDVVIGDVVDEFEVEVDIDDDQDSAQTLLAKNVSFADNSSRLWPVMSCDWFIRRRLREVANFDASGTRADPGAGWMQGTDHTQYLDSTRCFAFDTVDEMRDTLRPYKYSKTYRGYPFDGVFFARDVKCWFILQQQKLVTVDFHFALSKQDEIDEFGLQGGETYYLYNLLPVNEFGDFIVRDSDEADRIELKTVPVPVDSIGEDASAIFLPYSADENLDGSTAIAIDPDDSSTWTQPAPYREINSGDNGRHEYYDKLYLGYWTGGLDWMNLIPVTSNVHIYSDFGVYVTQHKSMRLNIDLDRGVSRLLSIDERRLYKFSFLSDSLPDPRAVYLIQGKRYICKRLQAVFSASGMSRLIKGEFYRL